MTTPKLDKQINKKIKAFDTKLKTSFILIRQDLDDMQIIVDAMKKYLHKKDKEYTNQNSHIIKSQTKIQKGIDDFTQEYTKLKLSIAQISAIKSELVLRKDLSKIEDRIKASFSEEIQKYKSQTISLKEELKESNKRVNALEKGMVLPEKRYWFKK